MADDHDRVGIAPDVVLQPEGAFEIEIVRRLVEEQQVRLGEEHGCECHAHAPSAGEARSRALLRGLVESEAGKDAGRPRLGGMGVDVDEARLDFGDAMAVRRGLGFGKQGGALAVRRQHDVDQGLRRARRLLRHLPDPAVLGQRNRSRLGREFAGHDPEQG